MSMTDDELFGALDGLYAYDTGSTDSGIHDEGLRARVIKELSAEPLRPGQLWPDRLARLVRDRMLNEESIRQDYGLEDVSGFIQWLEDYGMGART